MDSGQLLSSSLGEERPGGTFQDDLLADLDIGPLTFPFIKIQKDLKNNPSNIFNLCLDFVTQIGQIKHKIEQLSQLLVDLSNNNSSNILRSLITESVSKWIFYTNKIEFAGLSTEGDTLEFLNSRVTGQSKQQKEVINTFELLKNSYNNSPKITDHIFDSNKLLKWHRILACGIDNTDNIIPQGGLFRRCGVKAEEIILDQLKEPVHFYPHHSLIKASIENYCQIIWRLAKQIDQKDYDRFSNKVLYTFALAGFAQFHFVDIHPFNDGNGRICRLISKVILDSICPIPFPMFESRNNYLEALTKGRKIDDYKLTPIYLTELLIDQAINYYQFINRHYLTRKYDRIICAIDQEDLIEQITSFNLTQSDLEIIKQSFESLEEDKDVNIPIQGHVWRVKRLIKLTLDEL